MFDTRKVKAKENISITNKVALAIEMARRALKEVIKEDSAWVQWNVSYYIATDSNGPPRYQSADYVFREELYDALKYKIELEVLADTFVFGRVQITCDCFIFLHFGN